MIKRLVELEQKDLVINAKNNLTNHLKSLEEKGSQVDLSLWEHLKMNVFDIWGRSEEQIAFLLDIMQKTNAEITKNCFAYKLFFDKVLLDRESSICHSLLRKPTQHIGAVVELQKKFKEIADRAVTCHQICAFKRSILVQQFTIRQLIERDLPEMK